MLFDRVRGNAEGARERFDALADPVPDGPSTRDLLGRAAELIPLARVHRVDR